MTTQEVSIKDYLTFSEEEKRKFYLQILQENKKTKSTTFYITAENLPKQAKIFPLYFKQPEGKLTFIAPLKRGDKKVSSLFFLCICECGTWIILESYSFRNNKQTCCAKCTTLKGNNIKNISGQIFGQLRALFPSSKRGKDGSVYWVCECIDCGFKQEVCGSNLKRPNGHLCGICGNKSRGEYTVGKLLKDNNISFEKEKTFEDCIYPFSKNLAKFDF